MGLSRNKVAVSEGAAGSPPFYGESNSSEIMESRNRSQKQTEVVVEYLDHLLLNFQGLSKRMVFDRN